MDEFHDSKVLAVMPLDAGKTSPEGRIKERPIIFSSEMVRAIRTRQKRMTRRVVRIPKWVADPAELEVDFTGHLVAVSSLSGCQATVPCPYQVGDYLWVREATERYYVRDILNGEPTTALCGRYVADGEPVQTEHEFDVVWWYRHRVCPSIHMPRWASRITLKITEVRPERLQDISEEDARSEGIQVLPLQSADDPSAWWQSSPGVNQARTPRGSFADLWDSINGKRTNCAWKDNPWLWVVSFVEVAQ